MLLSVFGWPLWRYRRSVHILEPTGVSVEVLHRNEVIYTQGFCYRDVEAKIPADEQTIYHIASLSKAVAVAAFGSKDGRHPAAL